jgi:hypothetical protein
MDKSAVIDVCSVPQLSLGLAFVCCSTADTKWVGPPTHLDVVQQPLQVRYQPVHRHSHLLAFLPCHTKQAAWW